MKIINRIIPILFISFYLISNSLFAQSVVGDSTPPSTTPTLSSTLEINIPVMSFTTPKSHSEFGFKLHYSHREAGQDADGNPSILQDKYYWYLKPADLTVIPNTVTEGKKLYDSACLMCHQIGGSSSVSSTEATAIRAAMLTNTGGMGSLNYLTDSELEDIAKYISTTTTSTPISSVDMGKRIYDNNCLACHALGTSASDNSKVPSDIFSAILRNAGGMGNLSSLSDSDLEAIADYIKNTLGE